jgi:hypothetical protein
VLKSAATTNPINIPPRVNSLVRRLKNLYNLSLFIL